MRQACSHHSVENPKRRIWVVEKDDALRAALTYSLRAQGYTVNSYPSGAAAAAAEEACDCVVVDFRLSDMSGLNFLELLESEGSRTPAILMVQAMDDRILRRANDMNIQIIQKPLLGDELCVAVRKAFT